MKNIVIASDSFKGSLSSSEVAAAASEGFRAVFPECRVKCIGIADGGEGTTAALMSALGGQTVEITVNDPLMRPVKASYGITEDGSTAIMEMSAASGLPLLDTHERNPLKATTFGTGEMIADALGRGCRRILTGIGGSATNDAGMGMLSALGFRFLDAGGKVLEGIGANMRLVASVDCSGVPETVRQAEFIVACDVENVFCGRDGAAYVFAPQKGADGETVRVLDAGMENFAAVTASVCGTDIRSVKGAGAAGGLGGAFLAYLGGRLVPGSEMILDAVHFDEAMDGAELVITGEGKIDAQTSMGKIPAAILKRAASRGIPVVAIAGCVDRDLPENTGFAAVFPVTAGPVSLDEAMRPDVAYANVRRTVRQIAALLSVSS